MRSKKLDKHLIVGLDIGTTKIVVLVAEVNRDNKIEVLGIGTHPSRGLKRGVVVNIEATVQSIRRAIEEAELMSGYQVNSVYAGIAGSHVRSLNSHGIVAVRDGEVSQADVERVIDAAKALAIPADQRILHILPQEFIIDNQADIREPIGMSGVRLESKVHIVTGAVSAAQNIVKCVERCGLHVNNIILEQLASSHSVLTDDEKELGVCLVDIGGGTTDIALFTDGAIRHTAVIPIAGNQVTNDIAVTLRTPTQYAEQIKMQYGHVLPDKVEKGAQIDVQSVTQKQEKSIPHRHLAKVIGSRYEELFRLIQAELRRCGFESLIASGIVLTGGASLVSGAVELAESVFQLPVRLGMPRHVKGLTDVLKNPIYATAVGLLLYGHQQEDSPKPTLAINPQFKNIWSRMRHWFQGHL